MSAFEGGRSRGRVSEMGAASTDGSELKDGRCKDESDERRVCSVVGGALNGCCGNTVLGMLGWDEGILCGWIPEKKSSL